MRRLLLSLALLCGAAQAAPPAPVACPPAASVPTQVQLEAWAATAPDRGVLWRLRRDGRESWLFGSLHVGRAEWTMPGPRLREAMQRAEVLALELDPTDPQTIAALGSVPVPSGLLNPALQQRLAARFDAACVPAQAMAGVHPLLQLGTLSVLEARWDGLDPGYGVEMVLLGWARAQGLPVVALESASEQLRALVPSDLAEARQGLEQGLQQLERQQVRTPLRRLTEAWARGDLAELQSYEQWCDCVHDEHDRRWLRRLNDERNGPLAERIAALHADGKRALVAVGALHMSGPQALPLLLARLGFEVERVGPAAP